MQTEIYDVIIIGAGPGGLAAGLYAGRSRMKGLLIEKMFDGGQMAITADIENYPGAIEGETGPSLAERMTAQVEKFGIKRTYDSVEEVTLDGDVKVVKGADGVYHARSVIVATGASSRKMGVPGEKELTGGGVSYCATCDGAFFTDMEVYVVGGGDTALEEAVFLTRFAKKVTIIHRRDEFRAVKSIQEEAVNHPKIELMLNSIVVEVKGDDVVKSIIVEDTKTGERREVHANSTDGTFGLFVFVGLIPNSTIFDGQLNMKDGYIITDEDMRTNISGVFAVGDVRHKSLRQVVTAAADGAIAAIMADRYVTELHKRA